MKTIAYYRVSDPKQGVSGLGLEAQKAVAAAYEPLTEYIEVESGSKNKGSNRPQLEAALAHCKRAKATLVIAKLDRLARNVHFISGLMEAGVDFICCDMPAANRFVLHVMAAMAEQEARNTSERTKAGFAALRARGMWSNKLGRVVKPGNPRWRESIERARAARWPALPTNPELRDKLRQGSWA
jgi:DNA invertase Pin-like site-specific DNA recombinase